MRKGIADRLQGKVGKAFFPVEQALIVWTVAAMASSALIGAMAILVDFHGFCDVLMSLYYWLFKCVTEAPAIYHSYKAYKRW